MPMKRSFMSKYVIAHELGHAICAEVQDAIWYPTGLSFESEDGILAACLCDKRKTKKDIIGPFSKTSAMVNLGGIFGELLWNGKWAPWSARADVDEFITLNTKKSPIQTEMDNWFWVDDDELSFRSCSKMFYVEERRKFRMDCHDTARRLPNLWSAYLDFCDRIDKHAFIDSVNEISSNGKVELSTKDLREIIKEVVLK